MAYFWVLGLICYYVVLPVAYIFRALRALVTPLLQASRYSLHVLLYPLRLLAKFEALLIYFSVAAFVGVLTGLILYSYSSIFTMLFDLGPAPDDEQKTSPSRVGHDAANESWRKYDASTFRYAPSRFDDSFRDDYVDLLDSGRKRPEGLLSQTILEEDDSDS